MEDHLSLGMHFQRQAEILRQTGDLKGARDAFLKAADQMLLYAREVQGSKKTSAQDIARKLIEKAKEVKELSEQNAKLGGKSSESQRTGRSQAESDLKKLGAQDEQFVPSGSPGVHFSDIAGLEDVKETIRLRVIEPMLHPELYERFDKVKNGGILLYGPPGTGKTMIARAIATEANLDFYAVRCSDIVGRGFGDAERNLKKLFDAARSSGRAVIFFDEFEALACKRGGNSTVMNRLVPELLNQMDGFQKAEGQLIILASTNRPWDLDTAVLRPPRMSERIYVGLPDFAARRYLVAHALDSLPRIGTPDYDRIAEALEGFNCADIISFIEKVKEAPIMRGIESGNLNQYILEEDIMNALKKARSSVQKSDLDALVRWEATQAAAVGERGNG